MTTSANNSTANNTSATQMTVASFKHNYGTVSAYNVDNDTDFISRDECIAHANLAEIFGNEQPQARIETAQTVEIIVSTKATVQPTDIVLNDDEKGSDIAKPMREAVKKAMFAIFDDVKATGRAATLENQGVFKSAVLKQMPEKGNGQIYNAFREYIGQPLARSTNGTTTTTTKSKFTEPKLDQTAVMSLVMAGNFSEVANLTAQFNADMVQYKLDIETEKDDNLKAQSFKLSTKAKSLIDEMMKIYGDNFDILHVVDLVKATYATHYAATKDTAKGKGTPEDEINEIFNEAHIEIS